MSTTADKPARKARKRKARKSKSEEGIQVYSRLDPADYSKFAALAEQNERSVAAELRVAAMAWLKQHAAAAA